MAKEKEVRTVPFTHLGPHKLDSRGLIQYKDAILPEMEIPLWR